jgi:tripartite-type tricarboxylate transporter receptor subunit TctC
LAPPQPGRRSTHGAFIIIDDDIALSYNALADFAPVIRIPSFPLVPEVHPRLGVRTLKDFIAQSRARPGDSSSGSTRRCTGFSATRPFA